MEMRKGNLWKSIWLFSMPLMFTSLLQICFNLADVAVVGKFSGPISLGAVGSTTILVNLATHIHLGMSSGVNALTALFIGADEDKNLKTCVHTGILLCLGMGILVLGLSEIFSYDILVLLGTKDELIDEALVYFRLYMLGAPALGLFNYGNAVLSASGDTRRPLKYLTVAGIINVILNLFFVLALKMNASGVAVASIISEYISAFLVIRALIKSNEKYKLMPREIRLDTKMAVRILKISIPSAIQYSLFQIANLFVQASVNTFDHVVVEGNSAAANYDSIIYGMMAAFYTASTSFIAQNYGAMNKERIRKTYLITTIYSFGVAFVLGMLLLIFRREAFLMFTSDEAVILAGSARMGVMATSYAFSGPMDNATAACRGLGKTVVPTIALILGAVVFRITWIYTVFAMYRTIESLYALYICSWTFTAIIENVYFFFIYRKATKQMQ